ncbi:MAG: ATP-binding protein [bacterium]|nr:ATP-binding protein [bacterium]
MQQVRLTLPMIPNMELTASKTACAMGEQIGLSPDKIDEVQMAVVEACINAFEHSGSSDREVRILLQVLGTDDQPRGLQITIRDAGVGFSPDKITRLRAEETLTAPRKRGHGLRIIDGLMDEVDIQSDSEGTTVVMRKMR